MCCISLLVEQLDDRAANDSLMKTASELPYAPLFDITGCSRVSLRVRLPWLLKYPVKLECRGKQEGRRGGKQRYISIFSPNEFIEWPLWISHEKRDFLLRCDLNFSCLSLKILRFACYISYRILHLYTRHYSVADFHSSSWAHSGSEQDNKYNKWSQLCWDTAQKIWHI